MTSRRGDGSVTRFQSKAVRFLDRQHEPAFFQHPARCHVVFRDVGIQGTALLLGQEGVERLGRDAPAPELAAKPVTDLARAVLDETDDIPGHPAIDQHRSRDDRLIIQNAGPVRCVRILTSDWKIGRLARRRVELALEKDPDVINHDIAQCHSARVTHPAPLAASQRLRCL